MKFVMSLHIEERRKYHNNSLNITIDSYELKNAMPVPLLDGIKNVTSDTIYGNKNELYYYEKTIFNGSIINHIYQQKNYFTTIEMKKSISLYERIKNKLKNKKS